MADDKKSPGASLPPTGILWLVIIAAGALIAREVPWQGSRPGASEPKAYPYIARQDIDSRLWQDPLGAVVRGRDDIRKQYAKPADAPAPPKPVVAADPEKKASIARSASTAGPNATLPDGERVAAPATEASAHAPESLRLRIAADRKAGRALVVGVMIPGGSYPESIEYRRRMRYAALAGLDRMGFAPDDPEHLGYVMPQVSRLPEFIAYEWLSPKTAPAPSVLVLWLDENVFGSDTIKRVDALVEMVTRVAPGDRPPPIDCDADPAAAIATDFVIVGPSYTSTLQDMLRTVRSVSCAKGRRLPIFYPYGATADDAELLASVGFAKTDGSVHDVFRRSRVEVMRTIGTDSRLLTAVKRELKLRGVDPAAAAACDRADGVKRRPQHVVLISERDSFYGRSLPDTMAADFRGDGCAPGTDPPHVHRFSYLRGLDGQVASIGADAASKPAAAKPDGAPADRTTSAKQIERPEGQGQLDYLRRLSTQLATLDHDLRRQGKGTIMAVGVLGSDVYDKLLVLQALRPQFQNVLFFTTDLDARMQHPLEQDWARNLIVASNFGLQLNTALQADILPFRDGYQTSVFLSTQIALTNALQRCGALPCIDQTHIDRWLATPRIFEIGRSTAFDFSDAETPVCDPSQGLAACANVHPPGSPRYTKITGDVFRDGVLLLFLGAVLLALAKGFGTRLSEWITAPRVMPLAICAAAATAVVAFAFFGAPAWSWVAERLTEHNDGEPVSLVQGVSIWPTEAIRLVAIVASMAFLIWAWRLLDGNLLAIGRQMRFEPEHQVMMQQVRDDYATWTWWRRLIRSFSFRLTEYSAGPAMQSVGLSWSAQVFWKKYLYQGRLASRSLRVGAAVVIYFVVAVAVIGYFGAPNTPYRGTSALWWNNLIVLAAVWMMLAVIFFVVDAIVFCHQIIHALQRDIANECEDGEPVETAWAASTLLHYERKFGIHGTHLDAWILMDFITMRTRVVAKLIYFPFIVISLMVLSRSPFFDNWTMPIGLVVVLGTSVLIVSGCAILLRESAEGARRKVLDLLSDDLIRLKGNEGRTGQQIEAMIAQVKGLHEGAFAPYSQQPLFRALLLPLSTFGGSALLDYLTMSSF